MNDLRYLRGGRATAKGCEYVQFERCEYGPAGHERSNHLVEIVRKKAGLVSGLDHGAIAVAMLGRLRFHRLRIGPRQARDHATGAQVGLHDLGDIFLLDLVIPDTFGIGDHDWSVVTQAEAAAGRHLNFVVEPLGT